MFEVLLYILGVWGFGFLISLGFRWNSRESIWRKLRTAALWPVMVVFLLLILIFYKGN